MTTKRLFPDYDVFQTPKNGKVAITLITKVRSFEMNTQKWYQSQVSETTICDHDKVAVALNDAMGRFLETCYLQMTVGFPSPNIVDVDSEPLFKPDESQIPERERMKNFIKKKLGISVTSSKP